MSAIIFRTKAKGNLPHLSYIFHNLEARGKELNTVTCYVTGTLVLIDVQIGKEVMNHLKYQQEIGATASFTKRIMESTKIIGQKYIKWGTKFFIFIFF